MSKIAVIGAKGMLGADLVLMAKSIGHDVLELDIPDFDIRNKPDLKMLVSSSDIVINSAAYTNVDGAENAPELCYAVNANAVGILANECAIKRKYLLHISTDFVFGDIKQGPLSEMDATNPLNVYGRSKLEGERLVIESNAEAAILRLEWTYGLKGNNFIKKIFVRAKEKKCLSIVNDQIGSPTWTKDVSHAVLSLVALNAKGLFHFASRGYVSRFEVAKFAIKEAGLAVDVVPCLSSDIKTAARRPCNSCFDCAKIDALLHEDRPEWRTSLHEFISIMKKRGTL